MPKILLVLVLLLTSAQQSIYAQDLPWRESAIGVSVASLLVWNPMKLDGIGFDQGSDGDFDRSRLLWLWSMDETITAIGPISLTGHYEFSFGQITPSPQNVQLGFMPVLSWRFANLPGSPALETGLSANWLSLTEHQDREISTHFQFGEVLGLAVSLGDWELGTRYQHLSNGDIKKPNNGYNFFNFVVRYWY
ncbi:acyloxyacyl hydrolase [Reinekea marina]|uniref:Acyloxyacyl hydrolase n=1 Tax=Reinekea marina TaxID=1310421 RepID=A0ABV7WQZ9_9GAMM|nr:acyloxyacyl hydrolase [Reinekea marina]MDN3647370.1 acyloxyacyl hydrolase [Reinekea marina]